MKHFVRIIAILLMLSQAGCEQWMNLLPQEGLIREEFWQRKEDVEYVLMAAYETFGAMDGLLFKYGELRGDMIAGDLLQPLSEKQVMESNIYPDNPLCNWHQFYRVINYCNEVIYYAPAVREKDATFTDYLLQGFLAEAHFLRSLGYFYLVRIFKDVPLVLEPSINDKADFYIPKTEGQAILARIVNDLKAYRGFAPDDSFATLEENKGRASKAAFDALLADIALWEFRYEECLEHISSIEASRQHLLLPGILWFELFSPGSSVESIFEFQFDNSRGQNNSMFDLTNEYSHQYDPGNRAVDLLNTAYTGENVRGEGGSIKIISEDDFIIWKYVGLLPDSRTVRSGSDEKSCNWIVYRYAEILLMKAEALSQLGRFEEALESINKIRSRALMPGLSMPGSRADFEDAILEERMLELAFEGKRWFDLMRMGRRDGFRRKDRLINIIVSSVPSDQKKYMALKLTDPMGWYLPVYDEELERNRALVQNPYYQY